jgi:HAD superfamily hydrolase (TIGR01484 family)
MAMVALTERAERMNGLGQKLRGRLPEHHVTFEISPIDPDYFHATITPTGVSKGSGLRELALLMNVDLSETIAIGDNLNDLDMLETAGLGVAMGNATPETRARAGHVTASNDEDGVARVIERFIIEN